MRGVTSEVNVVSWFEIGKGLTEDEHPCEVAEFLHGFAEGLYEPGHPFITGYDTFARRARRVAEEVTAYDNYSKLKYLLQSLVREIAELEEA